MNYANFSELHELCFDVAVVRGLTRIWFTDATDWRFDVAYKKAWRAGLLQPNGNAPRRLSGQAWVMNATHLEEAHIQTRLEMITFLRRNADFEQVKGRRRRQWRRL